MNENELNTENGSSKEDSDLMKWKRPTVDVFGVTETKGKIADNPDEIGDTIGPS